MKGKYVKIKDRLIAIFTWEEINQSNHTKEEDKPLRLIYLERLNNGPLKEGTVVSRSMLFRKYMKNLDKSREEMKND